ncbi:MAG: dehydrogenase [Clostridiales bacterium]|nr:dehydrogenase [Clostridiales bacterium]
MPKNQYVDPNELRKSGYLKFKDIPLNQYKKTVSEVRGEYTDEELVRIFNDMYVIREFETMLNSIKREGSYNGVAYDNPGPAHLSMGQEAAAVGQAFHLTIDDYIFGSHRSHGEIIAKGLSAINKLSDEELMNIMKEFDNGRILSIVEKYLPTDNVKDLAESFLLYGILAEIFARDTGFTHGLGGSMHAFFLPFGIYPNNAIVGGSGPVATGAALYKKCNKKPGIVIANFGDGSLGCGPVLESLNFAAMDQYRMLWEDEYKGGLPILFNVMNNTYGMGGQTNGETMAYGILARLGAGVTESQLHSERVDGYNPLAVIDATKRKKELLLKGEGPAMLDVVTYRFGGHSPSDASTYRTKEEIAAWEEQDSIKEYSAQLAAAGVLGEDGTVAIKERIIKKLTEIVKLCINDEISPRMDLNACPTRIADIMYSNESKPALDDRKPDVNMPYEENPRVAQIAKKERYAFKNGKPVSKNQAYQLRDGIFEAVAHAFYTDPTLIAYGEDNRDWGGAFAAYRGLTEALPYHRFFNAPISEAAIVGTAVGYAMCGGRALVELMYCDFIGRAGDEVFNQLAKWQAMSSGLLKMPVVLRISVGSKYGAQHSQDWTSLTAHIPGLKVCFPATPYDAKGLLNTALSGTDPVIFFESQRIYDVGEQFHEEGVPEGYYEIPIGEPDIKREGKDITILNIGASLYRVLPAADRLKNEFGIEAEVVDARSLVPFNYDLLLESVKKTGRLVLVSDACERGSFLNDIARNITELAFDYLDAPPVVVGAKNWITPAYELDNYFFPQASWILDAINEKILPLKGYVPVSNQTNAQQIEEAKKGI